MAKKKLVVLTGAGVSADSGIGTFRDSGGVWDNYRIEDVCTPEALENNRHGVIDFYNMRGREVMDRHPNSGHLALVELEKDFHVHIITQNIDDLHERAGSSSVTHLHGEIRKLRSSADPNLVVPIEGWEQPYDELAPDGSMLRPFVVFFGEPVPMFEKAVEIISQADIAVIAGTSLAVYPAASLIRYTDADVPVYVVDPGEPDLRGIRNPELTVIRERAACGLPKLAELLRRQYGQ